MFCMCLFVCLSVGFGGVLSNCGVETRNLGNFERQMLELKYKRSESRQWAWSFCRIAQLRPEPLCRDLKMVEARDVTTRLGRQ